MVAILVSDNQEVEQRPAQALMLCRPFKFEVTLDTSFFDAFQIQLKYGNATNFDDSYSLSVFFVSKLLRP